jgi:hypothetical protein
MISRVLLPAALVVTLAGGSAEARAETYIVSDPSFLGGNELLIWCDGGDEARNSCRVYIAGVVDAIRVTQASSPSNSVGTWRACFPPQFEVGQAEGVVRKFLRTHPEWLHQSAARLTARAFAEAFPCPPAPAGGSLTH